MLNSLQGYFALPQQRDAPDALDLLKESANKSILTFSEGVYTTKEERKMVLTPRNCDCGNTNWYGNCGPVVYMQLLQHCIWKLTLFQTIS